MNVDLGVRFQLSIIHCKLLSDERVFSKSSVESRTFCTKIWVDVVNKIIPSLIYFIDKIVDFDDKVDVE